MRYFPTAYSIFNVESLGEDVSDYIVKEYLEHCVKECIATALEPFETSLNSDSFNFEGNELEVLGAPGGFLFDEDDSIVPVNSFMLCDSFMKLRGTKYGKFLKANHIINRSEEEQDDIEPLELELDYAENHLDRNWTYYSDIDYESYSRVINCYQEAADDGDLNALWCLGCAFDWLDCHYKQSDAYGLTYYYLSKAIRNGHLACIPALCDRLNYDGLHKEAFLLTYAGAQKKELYCMWNLARYYLCGIIVSENEKRAIELYESIMDAINNSEFIHANYDGIKNDDLKELKEYVEQNLKIIKSGNTSWKKYFDKQILKKFDMVKDKVMQESFEIIEISEDWVNNRIKELMRTE